jgi:Tol biopolymer transport system component
MTIPLGLKPRSYAWPVLSPDGQRLAVAVYEGRARNIWIGSVEREPLTRVTFGNDDWSSQWTRDGRGLIVNSGVNGRYNIFSMSADGSGKPQRLTDSPHPQRATSLSPGGDVILFNDIDPSRGIEDTLQLSLGSKEIRPVVEMHRSTGEATFSPDGRWVAYQSAETGHTEVYVQAYPGPGVKTQVSVDGGTEPIWNRNGRELFYTSATAMMAVPIVDTQNFRAGAAVRLFSYRGQYDVSADGQRFLVIEKPEKGGAVSQLNLVQNWFAELKARVPTK